MFHGNRTLRTLRRIGIVTISGANALARNGPALASFRIRRKFRRRRILHVITSIRTGSRRPVTMTVIRTTRRRGVDLLPVATFSSIAKLKVGTRIANRAVRVNTSHCVGRLRLSIAPFRGRTTHLKRRNGAPLCITVSRGLTTVVTITSPVGSAACATVTNLRRLNLGITVVANSGQRATRTVTTGLRVSRIITRILPSKGMSTLHRLRRRCEQITFINSKVGSTPTLTRTSINLTVKAKASITVRTTSIILVSNDLRNIPGTVTLDGTAVGGVQRGLF